MDSLQADLALALGPGYRIIRELGGAGMSRVFVAEEIQLEREVVVKVLPEQFSATARIDRFRREIQLAARLQHPHIVPVLSAGSSGDIVYYTMPFIKGESLRSMIARHGKIPPRVTIGILRDVADALCYAHEQGVVHRDVKPDNIMLQSDNAVVLDFGVAKAISEAVAGEALTSTGLALGTPLYMSPEQAAADPNLDERADIYSLGAVGYEMLTGRPPFVRASPQALMAAHITVKPQGISKHEGDIPTAVSSAVMKCLEKDPNDRWASARELRDELDSLRSTPGREGISVGRDRSTVAPDLSIEGRPERAGFRVLGRPVPRMWPGLAALLVLGVVAAYWYQASRNSPVAAESVAVLPFTNTSGRSENEYLSDGISEELINELGKVEGLRLVARTSSFAFKGSKVDIREIGRRLGVRNVVEGSVRRAGDSLRVTAQLINVENGYQAWSHAYDGSVRELFAVQKNISQSIAVALAGKLVVRKGQQLGSGSTNDLKAFDLYLQGRFAERQFTEESLEKAIALYTVAVTIDPGFALGYSAIAEAYYHLADDYLPPHQAYPKVLTAARAALKVDSTLAEAHASMASYEVSYGWNWENARQHAMRAVELKPSSSFAHMILGWYYVIVGQDAPAVGEAQRAASLEPFSDEIGGNVVSMFRAIGRHDLATAQIRRMMAAGIGSPTQLRAWLTWEYLLQNRMGDARIQLDSALGINSECCKRTRALLYAHTGAPDSALKIIEALESSRSKGYYRADFLAEVRAALGDREAMFKWLDQAYKDRSSSFPYFRRSAEMLHYRSDARYAALEKLLAIPATSRLTQ